MYDLNFFSIVKNQKQKNKAIRTIGFSVLALMIVLNMILFGTGFIIFNKLEDRIKSNQDYLDSAITKEKVKEIDKTNNEAMVAAEYLTVIQKTASQINQSKLITVELIDYIRGLAPVSTSFINAQYRGNQITLDCLSSETIDPINFYHRLLSDVRFVSVEMPGFQTEPVDGTTTFSIKLTLKGGEPS